VARRATKIDEIRAESERPVLVLDSGNTIFGQALAVQTQGQVIVESMSAMGYDAMTVGQSDLSFGLDVLLQRAQEADFAFLSCNLVNRASGQRLLDPYVVLERDGVRLGILGVTEPEAASLAVVTEQVAVIDPIEALREYLPGVREKSDVVVVLSHLGVDEDRHLARVFPGIDIIVGGRSRSLLAEPETEGNVVIVQAGYGGEWLGRLDVTLDSTGRILDPRVQIIPLGPEIADDPELKALVDSYRAKFPTPTSVTE
jgi:5'-nucleotidase/UDP-sugar diphosphatase